LSSHIALDNFLLYAVTDRNNSFSGTPVTCIPVEL